MMSLFEIAKKILPRPKGETRQRFLIAFMQFCQVLPINREKVVFSCFNGTKYSDNPKAIYVALKKIRPEWKYVWMLPDDSVKLRNAKVVKTGSFESVYHLATARVWIDNCRKNEWVVKRKKQYYVQTWHANVGLKKAEKDAQETLPQSYLNRCYNDSRMADLFIAGSAWNAQNYRDAYWYDGEILMSGLPRSDIFYKDFSSYYKAVCRFFRVPEQVHFCLYAPTFRDSKTLECYDIDFEKLKQSLESKWGGEWQILVRLHPNIQDKQNNIKYSDYVRNASAYKEINELIVASERLITDYSSCMFDAMEARKRVVLYATDIENFQNERQFYFELGKLPFPLTQTNNDLVTAVECFDDASYVQKCEELKKKLGICDGPDSSAKVAKYIIRKVEGRNN